MKANPEESSDFKGDKAEKSKEKKNKIKINSFYLTIVLIIIVGLFIIGTYYSFQSNISKRDGSSKEISVEKPERLSPESKTEESIKASPSKTEPALSEEKTIEEIKGISQETNEFIIDISGGAFNPNIVSAKPGTTITWVNNDNRPHKVAARDRSFYGTKISPGESYSYTFNNLGEYEYFDVIFYRTMKGKIIIEESKALGITGKAITEININRTTALSLLFYLVLVIIVRTSLSFVEIIYYNNKKKKHY